MSRNISIVEQPEWAMPKTHDHSELRFSPPSGGYRDSPAFFSALERATQKVIAAYSEQTEWRPLSHENWNLGVVIEGHSDFGRAVTAPVVEAVARALGVYEWSIQNDDSGAGWIDPEGEAGWQNEVDEICHYVVEQMKSAPLRDWARHLGKAYAAADLRKVMFRIVAWHQTQKAVLPPIAIKALAHVMSFGRTGDQWAAPKVNRSKGKAASMRLLAKMDADDIEESSCVRPAREVARELDVSHVTVGRWRKSSPRFKALLQLAFRELGR